MARSPRPPLPGVGSLASSARCARTRRPDRRARAVGSSLRVLNASSRAKALVVEQGIVSRTERDGIDKVLNAAAMTYVAAVATSAMTLLYFLVRSGVLGGRRD